MLSSNTFNGLINTNKEETRADEALLQTEEHLSIPGALMLLAGLREAGLASSPFFWTHLDKHRRLLPRLLGAW